MIARSYIETNLNQLNRNFIRSTSYKMNLYYSKLTIIELSGWVEESMDDIVLMCCNRCIKYQPNKTNIRGIVKYNSGLQYKKNFREMLIKVIGLVNIEKLEKNLGDIKIQQLSSQLGGLTKSRNDVAHTHIKGVAAIIDAPSVTIANFLIIYSTLKSIESELKKLGY